MKTRPQRQHKTRGFTLVELGIVVGVMSLLASSVLAGQGFIRASRLSKTIHDVHKIRKAVDSYAIRRGNLISDDKFIFNTLRNNYLSADLSDSIIRNVYVMDWGFKIYLRESRDTQNIGPELYAYFKDDPNYANKATTGPGKAHCHETWEDGGYGKLCFKALW